VTSLSSAAKANTVNAGCERLPPPL
jgi:hypothetical protein